MAKSNGVLSKIQSAKNFHSKSEFNNAPDERLKTLCLLEMRNGKYKKKLGSKVCSTEKPAKEPAAAARWALQK